MLPHRNLNAAGATEAFQIIARARDLLCDPALRAEHDRQLGLGAGPGGAEDEEEVDAGEERRRRSKEGKKGGKEEGHNVSRSSWPCSGVRRRRRTEDGIVVVVVAAPLPSLRPPRARFALLHRRLSPSSFLFVNALFVLPSRQCSAEHVFTIRGDRPKSCARYCSECEKHHAVRHARLLSPALPPW